MNGRAFELLCDYRAEQLDEQEAIKNTTPEQWDALLGEVAGYATARRFVVTVDTGRADVA